MQINEFKKFGIEVILKVLKKTDDEINKYKALEDYDGVKTLTTDVLEKYERLYNGLSSDSINNINEKELKGLELSLLDIMKKNNFELDYIESEILLRESLKGNSGAEAVNNLYNLQLIELEKKMNILLSKAEILLDEEAQLENLLREAIQEEEEVAIIEKMPEVRAKYSIIANKVELLKKNIDNIKEKVEKKWPCDIYGTISKEKLIKAFQEVQE